MVNAIGLNRLKNDIWARNVMWTALPNLTIVVIFAIIAQFSIVKALESDSVYYKPKLHKFLTRLVNPEMVNLMVRLLHKNKTNLF